MGQLWRKTCEFAFAFFLLFSSDLVLNPIRYQSSSPGDSPCWILEAIRMASSNDGWSLSCADLKKKKRFIRKTFNHYSSRFLFTWATISHLSQKTFYSKNPWPKKNMLFHVNSTVIVSCIHSIQKSTHRHCAIKMSTNSSELIQPYTFCTLNLPYRPSHSTQSGVNLCHRTSYFDRNSPCRDFSVKCRRVPGMA